MTTYTEVERAYLGEQALGRLATVDPDGVPQVRPVGFRLNEDGTIDIGGPKLSASLKWRNAERNREAAGAGWRSLGNFHHRRPLSTEDFPSPFENVR